MTPPRLYFPGGGGGSSNNAIAAAPAPPPNPNPTVATGDNALAADNAALVAQRKAAATQSSILTPTMSPSTATAQKSILGG